MPRRHLSLSQQEAHKQVVMLAGWAELWRAGIALGPPEPQVSLSPHLQAADKASCETGREGLSLRETCGGPENLRLSKGLCTGCSSPAGEDRLQQALLSQGWVAPNLPPCPQQKLDLRTLQVLSTSLCSHQSRGPSWLQGRAAQPWQLKGSKEHCVAAPGPCCDTMPLIRDKGCCLILCARLVSSHFGILLFLPAYFLQAE